MQQRGPVFADHTEVAEHATLGVRVNLDAGRGAVAAVMQPVARAAWDRVADPGDDPAPLRAACVHALDALSLTVGATTERRFLRSVIGAIDAPPPDPSPGRRKIAADGG